MNNFKKFWAFLKEDSWPSMIVSLILLVLIIKLIFFPTLSFITSSPLPLVVIESCSLYHETDFDNWWEKQAAWYGSKNITKELFETFHYRNGLNKGDIIFVWGRTNYEIGDIIIFDPNSDSTARHPIIHRIVEENPIGTKGDHNPGQLVSNSHSNPQNIDETNIPEKNILGKATLRIPALGWIKLIFFEPFKPQRERWFCS
jgi:hypothetical protein